MKRLLFIFILGGIFSCNDNLESDNLINELSEVEEANQMAGVLKFDSNDQIQEFLDELRDDKRVTNLTSDEVKKKMENEKRYYVS